MGRPVPTAPPVIPVEALQMHPGERLVKYATDDSDTQLENHWLGTVLNGNPTSRNSRQ